MFSVQSSVALAALAAGACAPAPASIAREPGEAPGDFSSYRRADPDAAPRDGTATGAGATESAQLATPRLGNPFWQGFVAEFRELWDIPPHVEGTGVATSCFHFEPDGRVVGTRLEAPSGDRVLDDSIQRAAAAIQSRRNVTPQPIPTEQLGIIRKWVCFRFNPDS
jgi:hypothetical protein